MEAGTWTWKPGYACRASVRSAETVLPMERWSWCRRQMAVPKAKERAMSESDVNPSASPVLAQLRGIARTFGSTCALRDASLTVRAGDSIAITGASGSGKSTLLSIMGLLDTPTDGSYMLCGEDVSRSSASHRSKLRRGYGHEYRVAWRTGRL